MARTSKRDQLAKYRHRLDFSRKWRRDEGYEATWHRLIDLYKGKHFLDNASEEDLIAINMAFSTVNVILPSISVNHPKIALKATKPEFEDTGIITEAAVNYWWRHHDWRRPFRRAVKDFLVVGHGWVKTSYRFVEEEQPLTDEEFASELEARQAELDTYAAENPDLAGDLPTDEDVAANIVSTKLVVTEDSAVVERVSPFDVFIDPEATSMDELGWIAQRIVRPLEEVRSDARYSPSARTKAKADMSALSDYDDDRRRRIGDDVERVTVWEFYDLRKRTVCVFSEVGEGYLIEPQVVPYAFGHPFVFLPNYEVPDQFYPIGDLEMIEGPQQELNKTRSQMVNHRKKYARKYLYRETAFDSSGREQLASDEDNVAVPVITDDPLGDVVAPVPIIPLSADLYNHSETIEQDINTITGINEYARGATPEIRRTATEAAIMQDAQNARAADKLAMVEGAITGIARHVVMLAQQYLTGEQVARIVGREGAAFWFTFTNDDIAGEFDFEVEGGSTQPENETFRRQQAVSLMDALGPMIGITIDPSMIAEHVLREGFGIKSPEKFILPPPPPMPPGMEEGGPPPDGGPMGPPPEQSMPPPPPGPV